MRPEYSTEAEFNKKVNTTNSAMNEKVDKCHAKVEPVCNSRNALPYDAAEAQKVSRKPRMMNEDVDHAEMRVAGSTANER